MNILITGGAGYLGSIITKRILNGKEGKLKDSYQYYSNFIPHLKNFTIYDNLMYRQTGIAQFTSDKRFNLIVEDVRNTKRLIEEVRKADIIIPLAAIVGFPACEKFKDIATQINFEQIKNIVDNMSKDQILIYPNTNSGYGIRNTNLECTEDMTLTPISHYGITKCQSEDYILQKNKGISLRLATAFGVSPRMRIDLLVNDFVYKAMTDGYIVLFEKDFKRNYIHIEDIASTFIFFSNVFQANKGNIFNVGIPNINITKLELAKQIKKHIPNFSISIDEITSDPDKRDYTISNKKIQNTGWRSKFSLDDGIQELIKAYPAYINKQRSHYSNQ